VNVSVNIPMLIRVQFSVFFYFSETEITEALTGQRRILTIDANSAASPANAPGSCSCFIGMCLLTRARVWLNRSELPGGKRRFDFSV
jgi:hypothetical protein